MSYCDGKNCSHPECGFPLNRAQRRLSGNYGKQQCAICKKKRKHFKSGVVNGEYITERCTDCFQQFEQNRNSSAAAYNLDREREDSARDIIQPWLPGGLPNPEFAHAYPQKAKIYYTEDQLKNL